MKLTYINNIPMAHGEVTVVTADNAEKVARHSCELASEIRKVGMGTLLINCGMSRKRFHEIEKEVIEKELSQVGRTLSPSAEKNGQRVTDKSVRATGEGKAGEKIHLIVHSSVRGDLAGERDAIAQKVRECKIGVVIIAGWEWTSNSYRRKERLLYNLRELMEDEDIAVIIYSQCQTKPIAGNYDRGGLGWLAMLAVIIVAMEASAEMKNEVPKPPPIVIRNEAEMEEAEAAVAQLLSNKINGLQPVVSHQSLVVSGEGKKNGKSSRLSDKKPVKNGMLK
jgi:hypothetical protein